MDHWDFMSPASSGILEKFYWRWKLRTSLTEGSIRCSQQSLILVWGLLSLTVFLLFQRIQLTTRWLSVDSSHVSSIRCEESKEHSRKFWTWHFEMKAKTVKRLKSNNWTTAYKEGQKWHKFNSICGPIKNSEHLIG